MISSTLILAVAVIYFLALFVIAIAAEKTSFGRAFTHTPIVFVLTLGIYATTWTFYGSIGSAANSSFLFLTVYIGPTLMMIGAYSMLKRLVRIRNEYGITSIADYLSNRYGKSYAIGMVATLISLIGGVPYFALQIKAVVSSYSFITLGTGDAVPGNIELVILLIIILFTISFGFRKLNQDESCDQPHLSWSLTIIF
jgi:Na+/proline symporter